MSSNVRFHVLIAATLRLRQGKQSNLVPRALFKAREKRPGTRLQTKDIFTLNNQRSKINCFDQLALLYTI